MPTALTPIAGNNRRTVAVVDSSAGDATGFWEPGPTVTEGEWHDFLGAYETVLGEASAVVLAGSLPPGLPADAYAPALPARGGGGRPRHPRRRRRRAARRARRAPGRDQAEPRRAGARGRGRGPGRRRGRPPGGRSRLGRGVRGSGRHDRRHARRRLARRAARARRRQPDGRRRRRRGGPDRGLVDGRAWPERLADAVALSAAAVGAPVAGGFDHELYRRLRDRVEAEVTLIEADQAAVAAALSYSSIVLR